MVMPMFQFSKLLLSLLTNVIAFFGGKSGSYRPERHYMRGPGPASQRKGAAPGSVSQRL
jgi:hypothetical protein